MREIGGHGVGAGPAGQDTQEPVRQLVQIAQPVMPVGFGLPQHARARVILYAFDRGLRRHAAFNGIFHAPKPTAVVGEHAIGLKDIAMLAGGREFACSSIRRSRP